MASYIASNGTKKQATTSPDYSQMINDAINQGKSASEVANLVSQREEKIKNDPSLSKYAQDSVYQNALDYIAKNPWNSSSSSSSGSSSSASASSGSSGGIRYTDDYGNVDYSKLIEDAINQGKSSDEVWNLVTQRENKINSDGSLSKYSHDQYYQQAMDYINYKRQEEQMEEEYNRILRQQEAAKQAAVDQAILELTGQKEQVARNYEDIAKQLYIDRRKSEKNLPQQLSALGYTGGLSESAALNLQTSYENALNEGEQARISALNELDRAIANAQLSGDISTAESAAQIAREKINSYAQLMSQLQAQQNYRDQFEYQKTQDALSQQNFLKQLALSEAQQEFERENISYNRKLQLAELMASYGDFSGYKALGIDTTAMERAYLAAMSGSVSSSSSGGSGRSYSAGSGGVSSGNGSGSGGGTVERNDALQQDLVSISNYQMPYMTTPTNSQNTSESKPALQDIYDALVNHLRSNE